MPVTGNAFNVIKDISSYILPRLIWIDSICIDQSNIQEKTHQVGLMGEIYTRASLVTVWLSPSTTNQSDLDKFNDKIEVVTAIYHLEHLRALSISNLSKEFQYQCMGGPRFQHIWQATIKLLDQQYFERSWIIQEVVLSASARVMYQGVTTSWEIFAEGFIEVANGGMIIGLLTRTEDMDIRSNQTTSKLANLLQVQSMRVARRNGKKDEFVTVAHSIRRFQATDPRDKVFAIQGLCEPGKEDWTVPEYSKSLYEVYLDSARRIIHEDGIIGHLEAGEIGLVGKATAGLEQLPSWVPDWSRAAVASNLSHRGAKLNYKAGGLEHREAHYLQGLTLILSTHIFDTVEEVSQTFELSAADDAQIRIFDHALRKWVAFAKTHQIISTSEVVKLKYGLDTDTDCERLLWRLLIGDRTSTERPAPPGVAELFFAWVDSNLALYNIRELSKEERNRPATEEEIARNNLAQKYLELLQDGCMGRRACFTSKGYVGLVPSLAQKDDVIAILFGAQTPLILRPIAGDRYHLVGECYIQGIMDGEALTGDISVQRVELV